jgi:uncharacterized protein (DUF1330 family)
MQVNHRLVVALFLGAAIGGLVVQGLYAQARPPAYVIAEIDVNNQEGYAKEYLPPSSKALLAGGAKYLARGSKTESFKGDPPKRIVLLSFENIDTAKAAFTSPAFVEAARIGEKYARFRIYAVEATPPPQ